MEPLDRATRQEIAKVIYKFRSEMYRNEDRIIYHARRINSYLKVKNLEMAEAHQEDMKERQKVIRFLRSEIDILINTLNRGRAA
jgi:hypothetical protein